MELATLPKSCGLSQKLVASDAGLVILSPLRP